MRLNKREFLRLRPGTELDTDIGNMTTVAVPAYRAGSTDARRVLAVLVENAAGREFFLSRRKCNQVLTSTYYGGTESKTSNEQLEAPEEKAPAPSDLAEMIAEAIGPHVKGSIDEDKVKEIIDERITALSVPRSVTVTNPLTEVSKDLGVQHYVFDALLRLCGQRLNTWLVGPAGSGKSTIASKVAEALDLDFYTVSVCLTTSESKLLGYNGVSDGKYVRTSLRDAYEFGGVFLLDEVDLGNPGILAVMNQLMAGTFCGFPDGVVQKHKDFVLIAGANTVGKGADRTYNARLQIDGATLDRFIFMEFGYDPAIEAMMCGVPASLFDYHEQKTIEFVSVEDDHLVQARCVTFCKRVNALRKSIDELKIRHIVSPRASAAGCAMIRSGFPLDVTMDMAVWKGLDKETVKKATSAADLSSIQ